MPAADTPEAAQGREATAKAVIAADSAAPVVDAMLPRLFSKMTLEQRPERVEPMKAVMEQTRPAASRGALRGMASRPDRRGDLPKIAVPTLVMVGEEDVITPPAEAQAMAEAIPNARLEVIPQAGHMAPYENPSAANAAILRFLKSLEQLKLMHGRESPKRSSPLRPSSKGWSIICGRSAGSPSTPSLSVKRRLSRCSA